MTEEPGPFVEEGAGGPPPITGVVRSTAAFVGSFPEGPLLEPVLVHDAAEAAVVLGPPASAAAQGLRLYFANGGRAAVAVRTGGDDRAALELGLDALAQDPEPVGLLCLPGMADLDPPGAATPELAALVHAATAVGRALRAVTLVDPPPHVRGAADVRAWLGAHPQLRSPDAAAYLPRLHVLAGPGPAVEVAASGAVAGVVARSEVERGVWVSPAGTRATLAGAGLAGPGLRAGDLADLAAMGVNALRDLPDVGPAVWGARTLAGGDAGAGPLRYLAARRLLAHVEASLAAGLRWVVFEPGGEPLWGRVRRAAEDFLHDLFRRGAFPGTRPEDAFYVRCDRTTMTTADMAAGLLVVHVGLAPLRPAEFVVIRLTQLTASAAG